MRKMILVALLASSTLAFAGCNSCRPRLFGWFNRGSACDPCCVDGCEGGPAGWIPRSAGMVSSEPALMPEPIEVVPAN
jgi:hypothetical protein